MTAFAKMPEANASFALSHRGDTTNIVTKIEFDQNCWSGDLFNRKPMAEKLTEHLIASAGERTYVISINGSWGTGKTFRVDCWHRSLSLNGQCRSAYFNAWQADDSDIPIIPLVAAVLAACKRQPEQDFFDTLAKVAERSIPLLAKAVARATLGGELAKEAVDAFAEIAKGETELLLAEDENSPRSALRQALEELIGEDSNPVVVFIDELDRCRPLFAIELLERIKHMFDIPNLVFVLALERGQLSESVKAIYGAGFDGGAYLRRFFDEEYFLPDPDSPDFCFKFINDQWDTFKSKECVANRHGASVQGAEAMAVTAAIVFESFDLTLRDQLQCLQKMHTCLSFAGESGFSFLLMVVFVTCQHLGGATLDQLNSKELRLGDHPGPNSIVINNQDAQLSDLYALHTDDWHQIVDDGHRFLRLLE